MRFQDCGGNFIAGTKQGDFMKDIGLAHKEHPFWFYRKVALKSTVETCVFELNAGYDYHLKYYYGEWVSQINTRSLSRPDVPFDWPGLSIQLVQAENSGLFDLAPIPLNLLGAPAGATLNIFPPHIPGLDTTSGVKKFCKRVDHVFKKKSELIFKITGQEYFTVPPTGYQPYYLHLLAIGYKIPSAQGTV